MLSAPTTAWRICACPLRRCRDLRPRREKLSWRILRASRDGNVGSVPFPSDYIEMVKQAQDACQAALDDSKKLLEVEVPPAGLNTVSGDEEGGIEMNISMEIVQKFCAGMFTGEKAPRTRVFFPELAEMNIAKSGVFDGSMYKLDYLTKPSPWDDIGLGKKVKMSERTRPTDATFVVAYPFFNPNEMLAVEELYRESAKESGCPIIVINGDLDKIRNGCILKDLSIFWFALASFFLRLSAVFLSETRGSRQDFPSGLRDCLLHTQLQGTICRDAIQSLSRALASSQIRRGRNGLHSLTGNHAFSENSRA
ncbi:uncharacterized protein LOC9650239 isoform X1 [Selaginella moellendorffii]|uniref:uncharacterized protein LOC9650239 isoform X1 n=1 Tax=Selaginella moellendorffii TaxID=88036 RepID=UPI000D1CEFCB|nr:uncharacterized protein LOC9650239 isoform X1 [Selaginella moellendorffii]|eukprot:XP_024521529.1 uncharacterized protein LOC9650239 isoform X1 [Selaginella moellendorffii]